MLELWDVSKRYGDVAALVNCTFRVRSGRLTGFVGPNGAGKTTAVRASFGLVAPDAGTVSWCGHAVSDMDRRRFGYMPEERGLYPRMRVADQLVFLGRLSGLSVAAAGRKPTGGWTPSDSATARRPASTICHMATSSPGFARARRAILRS